MINGFATLLCILLGSSRYTFMKVLPHCLLFTKQRKAEKMAFVTQAWGSESVSPEPTYIQGGHGGLPVTPASGSGNREIPKASRLARHIREL